MSNKIDKPNIVEIDCLEAIDNLYAYLDGELVNEETLAKFKQHLTHCRSCYSRAELEGILTERIKESGKGKTPESLQSRLRHLIDDF